MLTVVFSLSALITTAQTAFETLAEIKKVNHPVYKIELNFAPEVVEAALKKISDPWWMKKVMNQKISVFTGSCITPGFCRTNGLLYQCGTEKPQGQASIPCLFVGGQGRQIHFCLRQCYYRQQCTFFPEWIYGHCC